MRHWTLGIAALSTLICRGTSAGEAADADLDIVLALGVPVLGYSPAVAVRPEGREHVGRLRSATSISSVDVHSQIGFIRSDARLFMKGMGAVDGPSVIGTHFTALVEPFRCSRQEELTLDLPWRNPCVAGGYAYRGEYNTLVYDHGRGTFAHAVTGQVRVLSADLGMKEVWMWAEWIARGSEPAFLATEDTDAPAKALEKDLVRLGITKRMALGENGRLFTESVLYFSHDQFASARYRIRYLHEVFLAVLDRDDGPKKSFDFSVYVGAEIEGGVNASKHDALGKFMQSFRVLVGMPIGG